MYIIIIAIVVLIVIILGMYNNLVKLRNNVKQSESGIDVYLNQRFDLIPNLVECVKAYSKYEKETFEKIIEARQSYIESDSKNLQQAQSLNNQMSKVVALAESYPELKASEQYLNLQKNLSKIESQLQAARRIYNSDVTAYNTKISVVPSNIIAGIFGFEAASLFEIEEYKRENVNVSLEEE